MTDGPYRTAVSDPDDPRRTLAVARPDEDRPSRTWAWSVSTILLTGDQTAGRYTLIDMRSSGGGPPHRHDFEEMFTVLDGEVESPSAANGWSLSLRTVNAWPTPHTLHQRLRSARALLCLYSPSGQEQFFSRSGSRSPRTEPPRLDQAAQAASSRSPRPWPAIPRSCCCPEAAARAVASSGSEGQVGDVDLPLAGSGSAAGLVR